MQRRELSNASVLALIAALGCAPETFRHSTAFEIVPQENADVLVRVLDAEGPPAADTALVVRLAFGASADLDLYVTDPWQETAYFARTTTRTGGRLVSDERCDTPAPRIETIRFPEPLPGRYRVGVDHAASCEGAKSDRRAPFVLRVERGALREEVHGALLPGEFQPVLLELEID